MAELRFDEPTSDTPLHETYVYDGDTFQIASDDPVVVYSPDTGATCIGTGATTVTEIAYRIVETIGVEDGEKFDILLPAGSAHFSSEQENSP